MTPASRMESVKTLKMCVCLTGVNISKAVAGSLQLFKLAGTKWPLM